MVVDRRMMVTDGVVSMLGNRQKESNDNVTL
jgi:hypothetical protein